jgi:hypothetical protein
VSGTPVKNLSGRGFRFESLVGAYFAASMLAAETPLRDRSLVAKIRFQTGYDGWRLDDLLLVFEGGAQLAASVKSGPQFRFRKRSGSFVPQSDFLKRAWSDYGREDETFDSARDSLALIGPPPPPEVARDLHELQTLARASDPDELDRRVRALERKDSQLLDLYESFRPRQRDDDRLPGDLLRCAQYIGLDFESSIAPDLGRYDEWCRAALEDEAGERALDLANALYAFVDKTRTAGGSFTRARLVRALDGRFPLRETAASRSRALLARVTRRNTDLLRSAMTDGVEIARSAANEGLSEALAVNRFIVASGGAGVGKSALLKNALAGRTDVDLIWLTAADFEAADPSPTALESAITEAASDPAADLPVVLDGLDRSFDQSARVAARILHLISEGDSSWRAIVPCSVDAWSPLAARLADHNRRVDWKQMEVASLSDGELHQLAARVPQLAPLLAQPDLNPVLRNFKRLDLIAQIIRPGERAPTESEISVLFWSRLVERGEQRHERARLLEQLAERQAEDMQATVSRSVLSDLRALADLEADGICVVRAGRVGFVHDLYGAWSRQQLLLAHEHDLGAYLATRLDSPVWLRALRLHASSLLESGDGSIARWRQARDVAASGNPLVEDVFLEAAFYTSDPQAILEECRVSRHRCSLCVMRAHDELSRDRRVVTQLCRLLAAQKYSSARS